MLVSNRVASALAMMVIRLPVGRVAELGGRRIHDRSVDSLRSGRIDGINGHTLHVRKRATDAGFWRWAQSENRCNVIKVCDLPKLGGFSDIAIK
jgi:hypothetical protein